MENLNGGEIAILVMLWANLMYNAYKHGQPNENKYNVWVSLISTILSILLYKWAGLF